MSGSSWSIKPEILRCAKKTTAVCPFTQWYCWDGCAVAIREKDGRWYCGLNSVAVRLVNYCDGKDND